MDGINDPTVGTSAPENTRSTMDRAGSAVRSTATAGGDFTSHLIRTLGGVLETTAHAVGNVGVTLVQETARIATHTVTGVRTTVGSAISGTMPDFAEHQRQEARYRESVLSAGDKAD